jgi:hypothetical protein
MKRILSLVLVFVLVLGTFPVFADVTDYGAELKAMGLLAGDENGNLNPDQPLNRASMMVVLATYFGVLEDAQAFPLDSTFTDVFPTDWFAEEVAYAQVEGWTSGYGDGTFGPEDAVTEQMACAYLLRALGYSDAWATAVEDAAAMGIETDAAAGFTRANLFELMYETLHTENTDGVVLGVALGVMEEAGADELTVEEINILNLVEVEVVFNTELDEDSAEDASNYTIEDHDLTASLQDDGMTVILTMDEDEEFDNQEEFELEIDGLENVDGELVLEDFVSDELTAFDAFIPEALGVELTGPKTFDITFSEPVWDKEGDFDVEIEDGVYGVQDVEFDGDTVTVTLGTDLDEGEYEVVVTDAYDFAGFKALDETFTLEFAEDEDAPVAEVDSADETEVVLVFDEDVYLMPKDAEEGEEYADYYFDEDADEYVGDEDILEFFYHSYSAYTPVEVEGNGTDEITLTFDNADLDDDEDNDNPLPEGTVKMVVDVDANDGTVEDAWGNEVDSNIILYVEVVADEAAPEVVGIETEEYDDNDLDQFEFAIEFNEALNVDNNEITSGDIEDYVVVVDDEDDEMDIDSVVYYENSDDDLFFVIVEMEEEIEGVYEVTVSDFEDDSFSGNEMEEVTLSFEKEDETAPTLESDITAEYVQDGDDVILYIMFEEDMATDGAYSVLDEENYLIDDVEFGDFADDFEMELFGGADTVKVTFEDATDMTPSTLEVARLADAAGNKADDLYASIDIDEVEAPEVSSVSTISEKKLEIVVDGELKSVSTDGFIVENAGTTDNLASVSFEYDSDDDETTITATMKSDQHLANPADVPEYVYVVASEIEDMFGQYMDIDTIGSISDGYAPEFLDDDFDDNYDDEFSTTTIVMPFNEDFDTDDTYYAADFVVEVDGDEMVPFVDYEVTASGSALYLLFLDSDDLEDGFDVEVTVEDADYVADEFGNEIDDLDFELTFIVED